VIARRADAVLVAAGEECFLVQSGPAGAPDVSAIGERVCALTGARGGGRGRTFQGKGGTLPHLHALRKAAEETA
jgi:hypothetical protein